MYKLFYKYNKIIFILSGLPNGLDTRPSNIMGFILFIVIHFTRF